MHHENIRLKPLQLFCVVFLIFYSNPTSTGHSSSEAGDSCQMNPEDDAVIDLQNDEASDSIEQKIGPLGNLMMQNFGLTKQ